MKGHIRRSGKERRKRKKRERAGKCNKRQQECSLKPDLTDAKERGKNPKLKSGKEKSCSEPLSTERHDDVQTERRRGGGGEADEKGSNKQAAAFRGRRDEGSAESALQHL